MSVVQVLSSMGLGYTCLANKYSGYTGATVPWPSLLAFSLNQGPYDTAWAAPQLPAHLGFAHQETVDASPSSELDHPAWTMLWTELAGAWGLLLFCLHSFVSSGK